jgi:hypothetical protein
LVLGALVIALLSCYRASRSFRDWALTVDLRYLVSFHLTRFVGVYFLYLYSHRELPYEFAVPGGVGDIVVALVAIIVLVAPQKNPAIPKMYRLWNILGFVDILLVVFTAARLALANPASMKTLTHLPLSLLITFLVPIIIATHLLIFVRLKRMQTASSN